MMTRRLIGARKRNYGAVYRFYCYGKKAAEIILSRKIEK
jgi:hypothetical protein